MKKLFIVVIAFVLCAHNMYPMFYVRKGVHYAEKWVNPEGYVLDSQNAKLYQSLLDAINTKEIGDLCLTQFPDQDNIMHTFADALGKRSADRLNTLTSCLLNQSLIQDPSKQDRVKLEDMLTVNKLIIPDLFLALALKALKEQKQKSNKEKEETYSSGSILVDTYLYKFKLLSPENQILFRNEIEKDGEQISAEQQKKIAESWLLNLPENELEEVLSKRKDKKSSNENKLSDNGSLTTGSIQLLKNVSPYGSETLVSLNTKPIITDKSLEVERQKLLQSNPIIDINQQKKLSLGSDKNNQENGSLDDFFDIQEQAGEPWNPLFEK